MTYLDNNDFVSKEVLPEINLIVKNYLESEYSYIENEDDLEDLDNADVTEELMNEIIKKITKLVDDCSAEYDFTKVNEVDLNKEDLRLMVESALYDYKDIMYERYNDLFDREEYLDEYYSDTEF